MHQGWKYRKAFCILFALFFKPNVSLYINGFYLHTDPETRKILICKEVLVPRGFEAVPCKANGTEDSVRKCQAGLYQPDETNSSNSPECIAEQKCTEEGAKEDTKCIGVYCWKDCICDLKAGKCGLDYLSCSDTKDIKCAGKIQQDCSCALPENTTTSPTSPPTGSTLNASLTISKPTTTLAVTTDIQSTDTPKNTYDNGTDTGSGGIQIGILIPVTICGSIIVILIVIILLCVYVRRQHSNRRKKDSRNSTEMLEQGPKCINNGVVADKISEVTDSGVSDLTQDSHESHELLRDGSGSEMNESALNNGGNNTTGNNSDHQAAGGQSSHSAEEIGDLRPREEPTLANEEAICEESDSLLRQTDDQVVRDDSQRPQGKTKPNNSLIRRSDNPNEVQVYRDETQHDQDETDQKSISIPENASRTNLHNLHENNTSLGNDPELKSVLPQSVKKKEPEGKKNPMNVINMEDNPIENVLSSQKKVCVVPPTVQNSPPEHHARNQVLQGEDTVLNSPPGHHTRNQVLQGEVTVQNSPPGQHARNQVLQGEGYSSEFQDNWSPFTSSLFDSTNHSAN